MDRWVLVLEWKCFCLDQRWLASSSSTRSDLDQRQMGESGGWMGLDFRILEVVSVRSELRPEAHKNFSTASCLVLDYPMPISWKAYQAHGFEFEQLCLVARA